VRATHPAGSLHNASLTIVLLCSCSLLRASRAPALFCWRTQHEISQQQLGVRSLQYESPLIRAHGTTLFGLEFSDAIYHLTPEATRRQKIFLAMRPAVVYRYSREWFPLRLDLPRLLLMANHYHLLWKTPKPISPSACAS